MMQTIHAARKTLESQKDALEQLQDLTAYFEPKQGTKKPLPKRVTAKPGKGRDPVKNIAPIADQVRLKKRRRTVRKEFTKTNLRKAYPIPVVVEKRIQWNAYNHEPGTRTDNGLKDCHRCGKTGGHACPRPKTLTVQAKFYSFYPREYLNGDARDELLKLIQDTLNPDLRDDLMDLIAFFDTCAEEREEQLEDQAAKLREQYENVKAQLDDEDGDA